MRSRATAVSAATPRSSSFVQRMRTLAAAPRMSSLDPWRDLTGCTVMRSSPSVTFPNNSATPSTTGASDRWFTPSVCLSAVSLASR